MKNQQPLHYSMLIQWSDEDQAYIVSFPEWAHYNGLTHGATYAEAARKGLAMLSFFAESAAEDGEQAPQPWTFIFKQNKELLVALRAWREQHPEANYPEEPIEDVIRETQALVNELSANETASA